LRAHFVDESSISPPKVDEIEIIGDVLSSKLAASRAKKPDVGEGVRPSAVPILDIDP
jgi:hypothetical protein